MSVGLSAATGSAVCPLRPEVVVVQLQRLDPSHQRREDLGLDIGGNRNMVANHIRGPVLRQEWQFNGFGHGLTPLFRRLAMARRRLGSFGMIAWHLESCRNHAASLSTFPTFALATRSMRTARVPFIVMPSRRNHCPKRCVGVAAVPLDDRFGGRITGTEDKDGQK